MAGSRAPRMTTKRTRTTSDEAQQNSPTRPGARKKRARASAAASARARARPAAAAARARPRAPACASRASRAARCRCTAACPSAASGTRRSRASSTRSISAASRSDRRRQARRRRHRRCRGPGQGRRAAPGQGRRAAARQRRDQGQGRVSVWGASKSAVAAVEKAGGSVEDPRAEAEAAAGTDRLSRAWRPAVNGARAPHIGRATSSRAGSRAGPEDQAWCLQQNNWRPISISRRSPRPRSSRSASGSRSARCWSIASAPTSRCPASIPRLGPDLPPAGRRHPRHVQHVLRRRHPPDGDLRAQHHAVHLGLDHHPADDDGVAHARAAQEGGRAGPQGHQPVHALSHRGAGGVPGLRHRHRA